MMALTFSVLWTVIKNLFLPAVLIWIQVKLSGKKKIRWSFAFIGVVVIIFVANYTFLTNTASVSKLEKLSSTLPNGNRAEMYVRENSEKEIIAYSTPKIINRDGIIIDEEESIMQMRYPSIISEMVDHRSLANSVWEDEEILANPQNIIFEYNGGIHIISVEILFKQMAAMVLVLILICGINRFLLYREKKRFCNN